MRSQRHTLIGTILLIILLTGGTAAGAIYYYFLAPTFQLNQTAYIYIDRNDTFDSVCLKIEETGQPKTLIGFRLLAQKTGYISHIRTGRYAIRPADNARLLFHRLSSGHQSPVNVVIPSVRTLDRLAHSVANQLMIDSMEIIQLLKDTTFCSRMGYTPATLPSLFIPNTYEMYWNISAENFIERMRKEHQRYWNEERKKKAEAWGLTIAEVSTLASIVDEETANEVEKPIIAGLYLNRLKKGMLLQADPTVKFSLQDFGLRRILFKHLEIDSPYNTYKHEGLPPGPIRIPSIQGLESVLHAEHHNYLYMCAKEDFSGTHNFATTLSQHAANARRYQQALNRHSIK